MSSPGFADSHHLLHVGGEESEWIQAIDRAFLEAGHFQRALVTLDAGVPMPLDFMKELGGANRCREKMAEGVKRAHAAIAAAIGGVAPDDVELRAKIDSRRLGLLAFEAAEMARRSADARGPAA